MPGKQYAHYRKCLEIKNRYPDGIPLDPEDRKIVLDALRMHPKGREKFGSGVQAVIVDQYVYGSRCFFVIRSDGTAEDFSLYKCFGRNLNLRRTVKLAQAMARFNYSEIVQHFRMFASAHARPR